MTQLIDKLLMALLIKLLKLFMSAIFMKVRGARWMILKMRAYLTVSLNAEKRLSQAVWS